MRDMQSQIDEIMDYFDFLEREEGQRQADRVRRMFDGRAMA